MCKYSGPVGMTMTAKRIRLQNATSWPSGHPQRHRNPSEGREAHRPCIQAVHTTTQSLLFSPSAIPFTDFFQALLHPSDNEDDAGLDVAGW
jgi:hypothetical protein